MPAPGGTPSERFWQNRCTKDLQTCLALLSAVQPGDVDSQVWPCQKGTHLASSLTGMSISGMFFHEASIIRPTSKGVPKNSLWLCQAGLWSSSWCPGDEAVNIFPKQLTCCPKVLVQRSANCNLLLVFVVWMSWEWFLHFQMIENQKKNWWMHENYTKFKFQCPEIELYGDTAMLTHLWSLCGCFRTSTAELSRCDRDPVAHKT